MTERKGEAFSFCKNLCRDSCQLPGGCGKFKRFVSKNRALVESRALTLINEGETDIAVIFQRITEDIGTPNTHMSAYKEGEVKRGKLYGIRRGKSGKGG